MIKDHKNLGIAGDIVKVTPGYARNYLLPRDIVIQATEGNLKKIAKIKQKAEETKILTKNENRILAEKIDNVVLVFKRKADENGHLYGSVTENDLVKELAKQGINIHKTNVKMEKHIKELGDSEIVIDFSASIIAKLKVKVEQE
jgi:large subunit ribosomal protein L9